MATHYWVGNSGNWNDTAHWSLESGGPGGAAVPQGWEDAIFDANSFTLDGQTVSITTAAGCNDIDFRNVTHNPTINCTDGIYIWRSAYFSEDMSWTGSGYVMFATDVVQQQTIDTKGILFGGLVRFPNSGKCRIISDLRTTADIDLRCGEIIFECDNIEAGALWSDSTGNVRNINFGNALIKANVYLAGGGTLTIAQTDYTIEPTFWLDNDDCDGFIFNKVSVVPGKTCIITHSFRVKHLTANGGFIGITEGTTLTVTDSLRLVGAYDSLLQFVDRNNSGTFNLEALCSDIMIDYCNMRGTTSIGQPVTAYRSFNGGRNTDVTFNPSAPPSPAQKFVQSRSISFGRRFRR